MNEQEKAFLTTHFEAMNKVMGIGENTKSVIELCKIIQKARLEAKETFPTPRHEQIIDALQRGFFDALCGEQAVLPEEAA